MNATNAKDIVLEMDAYWRPRADEVTPDKAHHRILALAREMMDAFHRSGALPDEVRDIIAQWRRRAAAAVDPIEQLRRPTAWDLVRLYETLKDRAPDGAPCNACENTGRRHVTAAVWRKDTLIGQGLVVACECGRHTDALLEGKPMLSSLPDWRRAANLGMARIQNQLVAVVLDIPPVYADVVAWSLRGIVVGEVPDDALITEVLRAVQAEQEAA